MLTNNAIAEHLDYLLLFRTFTQVSAQWQDTDSMREELDDLQVC